MMAKISTRKGAFLGIILAVKSDFLRIKEEDK